MNQKGTATRLNLRRAAKRRLLKRERVPLVRTFDQIKRDHGLPQVPRTDNGPEIPELLDEAFVQWAKAYAMAIQCIQPGNPNQNAYVRLDANGTEDPEAPAAGM